MCVFSPGETQDARKVGMSPGETVEARKTCSPDEMNYCVYYWIILLYKLCLSANSQEALSTCMNVLLNYYCIRSA